MKNAINAASTVAAYALVIAMGIVVVGACLLLLPVRWILGSSARREQTKKP